MADLTRRGFLGALAAAVSAPALPNIPVVNNRFVLSKQRLILSKPLILTGLTDFVISDCTFIAADDFPHGESMIVADGCKGGVVSSCTFVGKQQGAWGYS